MKYFEIPLAIAAIILGAWILYKNLAG